jgi:hypothetical protein
MEYTRERERERERERDACVRYGYLSSFSVRAVRTLIWTLDEDIRGTQTGGVTSSDICTSRAKSLI